MTGKSEQVMGCQVTGKGIYVKEVDQVRSELNSGGFR